LYFFESSSHRTHANESVENHEQLDPLLTAEDVPARLNVTKDWVWDHSSRKHPFLPVIRMSDGTLRYRASKIEDFIDERERLTRMRRKFQKACQATVDSINPKMRKKVRVKRDGKEGSEKFATNLLPSRNGQCL
jgi:hypothetical protein